MKRNTKIIIAVVAVAALAGIIINARKTAADPLRPFAECLKEKGAVFYGAFWCRHCQNQKKLFGKAAKYLPYVECSTPDGRSQLPRCSDKNIEGYPTWEFADSSRLSGEVSLQSLAEKTGCVLPL